MPIRSLHKMTIREYNGYSRLIYTSKMGVHYGYSIVTFFTFYELYLVGLRFLCNFASN